MIFQTLRQAFWPSLFVAREVEEEEREEGRKYVGGGGGRRRKRRKRFCTSLSPCMRV